jgi:ATP-dependent RNA helicase DeaD
MYVQRLYRLARVTPTWTPVPGPAEVQTAGDARLVAELGAEAASPADPRFHALAAELLAAHDPAALVAALLARSGHAGPCAPRPVTAIEPPPPQQPAAPRQVRVQRDGAPMGFVPFRINWGGRHGADARRLLAMVCRRGEVRSDAIGAIRIGPTSSTFEVSSPLAGDFARSARRPDTRDPRIRIEPFNDGAASGPKTRAPSEPFHEEAPRGPKARPFKNRRGEDRSAS